MLDVHVLTVPWTPPEYLEQCMASIEVAVQQAGYPVSVHYLPGIEGDIGKGRALGFSIGRAPYATYVDDDDYLLPHAFAVLKDSFASNPTAIYGREVQLQNGVFIPNPNRHMLCVYRRDKIIDYTQWKGCGDLVQRQVPGVDVLEPGYVYRLLVGSKGRALSRGAALERERMANG